MRMSLSDARRPLTTVCRGKKTETNRNNNSLSLSDIISAAGSSSKVKIQGQKPEMTLLPSSIKVMCA